MQVDNTASSVYLTHANVSQFVVWLIHGTERRSQAVCDNIVCGLCLLVHLVPQPVHQVMHGMQ
jgi:hypothetical protein